MMETVPQFDRIYKQILEISYANSVYRINTFVALSAWQSWIGHIAMQGKLITTAPIEYGASLVNIEGVKPGPYKEANTVK